MKCIFIFLIFLSYLCLGSCSSYFLSPIDGLLVELRESSYSSDQINSIGLEPFGRETYLSAKKQLEFLSGFITRLGFEKAAKYRSSYAKMQEYLDSQPFNWRTDDLFFNRQMSAGRAFENEMRPIEAAYEKVLFNFRQVHRMNTFFNISHNRVTDYHRLSGENIYIIRKINEKKQYTIRILGTDKTIVFSDELFGSELKIDLSFKSDLYEEANSDTLGVIVFKAERIFSGEWLEETEFELWKVKVSNNGY